MAIPWQIGNCVGSANHHSFIAFLISGLFSTIYVSIVSAYASLHMWPPLTYSIGSLHGTTSENLAWRIIKETIFAFLRSLLLLSTRGFVLIYLFIASVSMMLGLSALLWLQLRYIYEGETYLSHLSSQAYNGDRKKDFQNLVRFFGFPYSVKRFLSTFFVNQKTHKGKRAWSLIKEFLIFLFNFTVLYQRNFLSISKRYIIVMLIIKLECFVNAPHVGEYISSQI